MNKSVKLGCYFLKSVLFGTKFPMALSVDVTNKCNLRCKHCYFFQQNHKNELSEEDLLKKVKEIKKKHPSIIHASWVGGEPLLRKNVVEEGIKLFPFNMVVTNGSLELPEWKSCVFNVSVDGTKEYYEEVRGLKIYDKVMEHASRNDIHVNIACVLNKKNYYCIEDLLKEWKKTKIRGINFDFYTPISGIDDNLWLNWQERDMIIEKLIKLKKIYGNFILNSKSILKLMKSDSSKKITSNCVVKKAAVCLDPMGERKLPCVIGNKADCLKCGCIVPFQIESLMVKKQIESFYVTKKLFT
ncbi:radical SAM protein [Candidatus Parcubacteria bacterium]|nr:radical SAM protein [Candidatus Parcubacteria bacterium]